MRLYGKVTKGWGQEEIWVTNGDYCSKFLHFEAGSMFSMHFHAEKVESWYVISGKFVVEWISTSNAKIHQKTLCVGDTWHNERHVPHRLICLEQGTILEVSTPDSIEDNYRVMPGDSQR